MLRSSSGSRVEFSVFGGNSLVEEGGEGDRISCNFHTSSSSGGDLLTVNCQSTRIAQLTLVSRA